MCATKRLVASLLVLVLMTILLCCSVESGVIETNETGDNSDYFGIKIYPIERNCRMVGGMCVHRDDCAEGTSTQGLCKKSHHLGVECCFSVVSRPTTCQKLLGACMSNCNPALVREEATDCADDQLCCVLV